MKKYRVVEIMTSEGLKYRVERWEEKERNLFFGLWKRPSTFSWEAIPCGVYLYGVGYIRIHEKCVFDEKHEAIIFCNNLADDSKPKTIYSV